MTSRSRRWGARGSRAAVSGGGGGPEPVAAEPGAARAAAGPSAARATKARRGRLGIRYPPSLPLLASGQEGLRPGRYHGRPRVPIGARPCGPSIPARRRQSSPDVLSDEQAAPTPWRAHLPARMDPRHRTRMPRPKPSAFTGTAELNTRVARVAPDILELLADGVPRSKAAIVEALAGRYDRQDVIGTLIRLSVTGELEEAAGRYTLAAKP